MNRTSHAYRETDDGRELHYELVWSWRPTIPATYWEPEDGGLYVEGWRLDGRWIWEADVPADVRDELLADAHDQTFEERYYGT